LAMFNVITVGHERTDNISQKIRLTKEIFARLTLIMPNGLWKIENRMITIQ
jgi:hypothetical protein